MLVFKKAVTNYASHRLRANIQFDAIKKTMNDLKEDKSTVLMIIDHKQKIEPMKYRESQIEYYGKKGMSFIGMIMIRWKIADDEMGYEYSFRDYVVKGYTSQDHVQV